jgi:hypothetical protein
MSVGISMLELNWSRKLQAFFLGFGPSFVISWDLLHPVFTHLLYKGRRDFGLSFITSHWQAGPGFLVSLSCTFFGVPVLSSPRCRLA